MRLGLIFVALVLFLAEQRQFTHKRSANRTAAHHKSQKLSANAITVTVMKLEGRFHRYNDTSTTSASNKTLRMVGSNVEAFHS